MKKTKKKTNKQNHFKKNYFLLPNEENQSWFQDCHEKQQQRNQQLLLDDANLFLVGGFHLKGKENQSSFEVEDMCSKLVSKVVMIEEKGTLYLLCLNKKDVLMKRKEKKKMKKIANLQA